MLPSRIYLHENICPGRGAVFSSSAHYKFMFRIDAPDFILNFWPILSLALVTVANISIKILACWQDNKIVNCLIGTSS